ncbi:hypothetical protein Bca4012_001227 [Brassica carinata]
MKAMDPIELLGVLPTCHFGKLCSKKYLSVIHHRVLGSRLAIKGKDLYIIKSRVYLVPRA